MYKVVNSARLAILCISDMWMKYMKGWKATEKPIETDCRKVVIGLRRYTEIEDWQRAFGYVIVNGNSVFRVLRFN